MIAMQGPHQVAQKSMRYTFPSSNELIGVPLIHESTLNAGGSSPMFSVGISNGLASTPDSASNAETISCAVLPPMRSCAEAVPVRATRIAAAVSRFNMSVLLLDKPLCRSIEPRTRETSKQPLASCPISLSELAVRWGTTLTRGLQFPE